MIEWPQAPTLPPLRGGPLPLPQAREGTSGSDALPPSLAGEGWGGGFGRREWHNLGLRFVVKEAYLPETPATRLYIPEGLAAGATSSSIPRRRTRRATCCG